MEQNISKSENFQEFENRVIQDEEKEKNKEQIKIIKYIGAFPIIALSLGFFFLKGMLGLLFLPLWPACIVCNLTNIVWSVVKIKKLDVTGWFIFILNILLSVFLIFDYFIF